MSDDDNDNPDKPVLKFPEPASDPTQPLPPWPPPRLPMIYAKVDQRHLGDLSDDEWGQLLDAVVSELGSFMVDDAVPREYNLLRALEEQRIVAQHHWRARNAKGGA